MRAFIGVFFATGMTLGTIVGAALLNQESSKKNVADFSTPVSFRPVKEVPKPRKKIRRKKKKKLKNIKQAPIVSPNAAYSAGIELEMPTVNTDPMEELFRDEHVKVIAPFPSPSNPPPKYPQDARHDGVQGRVVVSVLIDEYGYVIKANIRSSKPKGVFDDAVLTALREWRFSPATMRGESVEQWVEIPFNFVL
jgi:protein TonB